MDSERRGRGNNADGRHDSSRDSIVITDARSAASAEQRRRQKRYAITMAFRTACFIAAIFVPGVARWVLIAGAVFLPYIAVVAANQADAKTGQPRVGDVVDPEPLPQITTGFETISGDVAGEDPETDRDGDRAA